MTAYVSAFDLFSIGVGPSSSHTVGPMRAARDFALRVPTGVARITCELYGSLGATGIGHGTPDAIVAGLSGLAPETVDPARVRHAWQEWADGTSLLVAGVHPVPFSRNDISFSPFTRLPGHPNALKLTALDASGAALASEIYYSIGGGFIRREGETAGDPHSYPLHFATADGLLAVCAEHGLTIAEVARRNEESRRSGAEVDASLDALWDAMNGCIDAGLHATGQLPGLLQVRRRAGAIREQLEGEAGSGKALPGDWLGTFALAVNEENASGGRVVTAPTNGRRASCRLSRATGSSSSTTRMTHAPVCASSCSRRPPWGRCSKRTRRSRAPRADARPKSARHAPWPRADSPP